MKNSNKKRLLMLAVTVGLLTACNFHQTSSNNNISSNDSTSLNDNSSVSNFISSSSSIGYGTSLSSNSSNSSINSSSSLTSSSSSSSSSSSAKSSSSSSKSSSASSSSSSSSSKSSSSSSSMHSEYEGWDVDTSLRGVAFRDKLASLINKKGHNTTNYGNMVSVGAKAAAYGNSGKFIPFYHGPERLATQGECNREHTWPNSRGGGNVERDPFVIRPTLSSENSDRSNYFYGLNGKAGLEWDPASCGYAPARGESARVIFYIACRYGKTYNFYLTNTPNDNWNKVKTMGRLDRMYEWNKLYPPTQNEIQINNYLESQGYGRNPFVDYPELVDYIWDKNGYVTDNTNFNSYNLGTSYSSLFEKCSILPSEMELD